MTGLTRAKITPIDEKKVELTAKAFDVQFNPSTLRFQSSAQPPGGAGQSSVPKQAASNAKTSLSLDLHFDTYDEAEGDGPMPVTRKVAQLEQFLKPLRAAQGGSPVPPPPRMQFLWGGFKVTGVVTQLTVEYDHFHHSGAPLRAKCSLAMEVQDPELAAPQAASGAGAAAPSGAPGNVAQPGRGGPGPLGGPDAGKGAPLTKGALAQAGESLAAFAQRNGMDPRNWRGLARGIADVAKLPAGLEITFNAEAGSAAPSGAPSPAARAAAEQVAAGGPFAQAATARQRQSQGASDQSRQAFGLRPVAPPPGGGSPGGGTGGAGPSRPSAPAAAPVSAQADLRPFGAGVPLRPRLGAALPAAASPGWGGVALGHRAGCGCGCGGKD